MQACPRAVGRSLVTHSHTHAGTPDRVRSRRALYGLAVLLVVATAVAMVLLRPGADRGGVEVPDRGQRIGGVVTTVASGTCPGARPDIVSQGCVLLTIRLQDGPEAGQQIVLDDNRDVTGGGEPGQRLVLVRADGDLSVDQRYELVDVGRGVPLALMAVIFALAVVALGRWRGALALAGLALSLLVLVSWLVPALLSGRPPVLTATVGASAVMIVALFLSHGISLQTVVAMLGTAGSLLLIIGLSTVFVELASLTGVTSEEAQYVQVYFDRIDLRGLLLAGIVIGALGILDDVTVTQVSTVWELRRASPTMPGRALFAAGLRVGRDHIASTVNTLLLAYAGASLPLLVIFTTSGDGLLDTVTNGLVGQEIVRTLAGSIGLVAAVPLTTGLAAYVCPPTMPGIGEAPRTDVTTSLDASRQFTSRGVAHRPGRHAGRSWSSK